MGIYKFVSLSWWKHFNKTLNSHYLTYTLSSFSSYLLYHKIGFRNWYLSLAFNLYRLKRLFQFNLQIWPIYSICARSGSVKKMFTLFYNHDLSISGVLILMISVAVILRFNSVNTSKLLPQFIIEMLQCIMC